ncbi:MAG: hypothetical protein EOO88_07550 [Pedobacter sp.]|nr:MAG: hypothetical protein EOO88_07550 [Pedobacter sp.]
MMDIDLAEDGTTPVPVSPVIFQDSLSKRDLIPVVFIVNNVLKDKSQTQLDDLAAKLLSFVKGKVSQAGKARFSELQIDCDWTKTTRDNYFYLLKQIRSKIGGDKIVLSATLRLHQLKNLVSNGIPPVDRVMLMCYNMGNLRKYGDQNSILEEAELRKYVGKNLTAYPMPVDVGLPLFSWAVAFRGSGYIGIPKKITEEILRNDTLFTLTGQHRFVAKNDLAAFGLKKGDEIRWESVSVAQLQSAATYIANYLKTDTTRVIYFHLDETLLKKYTYENLEKTTALFR